MKRFLLAAAAATAFASTAAWALVTFDPDTGTGFVGKGDVQLAFGWNNAQLQSRASGVTFTYQSSERFEYTCEWYTGPTHNRKRHEVDHKKTTSVHSTIAYDARKNSQGQITGFNLVGLGGTTSTGDVPEVDGDCPGTPGTGAVVIDVQSLGMNGDSGLYTNYNGVSVLLNWGAA